MKSREIIDTKQMELYDEQTGEVWKPIKGAAGAYEISNYGRCKSVGRTVNVQRREIRYKAKILRAGTTKNGYKNVRILRDGIHITAMVHRIVAETFIPNPENKREVNHIDGNKANNKRENLEWATTRENSEHSINVLGKHRTAVIAISDGGEVKHRYYKVSDAVRDGYKQTSISRCIRGVVKHHRGLIWVKAS